MWVYVTTWRNTMLNSNMAISRYNDYFFMWYSSFHLHIYNNQSFVSLMRVRRTENDSFFEDIHIQQKVLNECSCLAKYLCRNLDLLYLRSLFQQLKITYLGEGKRLYDCYIKQVLWLVILTIWVYEWEYCKEIYIADCYFQSTEM